MPSQQAVQPLRIQKSTPSSSPSKMSGSTAQRPLSEINPGERRRNSPSFNQATKKMMFNTDSSPFDSSPYNPANAGASPRTFWQGKDYSPSRMSYENSPLSQRGTSTSPTKRSSIENLKKASRVKNSSMFAREQQHEYDPASAPLSLDRPLATGRPLSTQVQGNAFGGRALDSPRLNKKEVESKIPTLSPSKTPSKSTSPETKTPSPSKNQSSPTKSSLSNPGRFTANPPKFDPESGTWSEDETSGQRKLPPGRTLHRHAKSVTFDAAPPQINEYEMTTPDLSSNASGSREGSYDSTDEENDHYGKSNSIDREDSFDASLEDIQKTPVVGPEHWHDNSHRASAPQGEALDDPFLDEGSPLAAVTPNNRKVESVSPSRMDSPNGERRPLPPLPGLIGSDARFRSESPGHSSPIGELAQIEARHLPSPPRPSSVSKAEIQAMSGSKMSLEDRLRLMMLQESEDQQGNHETQRERRMRRAGAREKSEERVLAKSTTEIKIHEDVIETQIDETESTDYKLPRISRESILKKVHVQRDEADDVDEYYSSPVPGSSPDHKSTFKFDPDTPLPSTEVEYTMEESQTNIVIKTEEDADGSQMDLDSIPELKEAAMAASRYEVYSDDDDSIIHHDQSNAEDDESLYSREEDACDTQEVKKDETAVEHMDGAQTPRASTPQPAQDRSENTEGDSQVSLPQFASGEEFSLDLRSFMSASPGPEQSILSAGSASRMSAMRDYLQQPITPPESAQASQPTSENEESQETPQTPDSVVRHRIDSHSPPQESPGIPEPVATIKAPGGQLKTRQSMTPADMAAMAATRREVSGETKEVVPAVPPIPQRHRNRPSITAPIEGVDGSNASRPSSSEISRRKSLVKLEMPVQDGEEDLSFGLDKEFDRLLEAKKKGYLMRQNTKVVVASSISNEAAPVTFDAKEAVERGTRSAGNSPRKTSHDRTKSWSVEPWNGKMRRNSIKVTTPSPKKRVVPGQGSAPPLPGAESNVAAALDTVAEDRAASEDTEPTGERGRLFVKVVGVRDMELPLSNDEKTWFCLTLDNGLHCVTTSYLEMNPNAPIGQEFELVVLDDLEFMLTLQAKVEKPAPVFEIDSPSKSVKGQKPSTFSRVFASPKKRKQMELQQQEEERAARQRASNAHSRRPSTYDILKNIVAQDEREIGSFARAYVCLKDHESQAYGRPHTVQIACFNEWATEEVTTFNNSSVKSNKRGGHGMQRKAPYKIGKIELQLLFVPKPKGAKDEDMPKSMNGCIRELREAEASAMRVYEGYLSQQGGDCPYWRRRFFKLTGSKLTAFHETTRQPRATINLAKASKLIDDRSSLTKTEVSTKSGKRRKSAFAEEEEGYMFVEEGFRIRFANGEVIDFYADNAPDKEGWMKVLYEAIGKGDNGASKGGWTAMVLAREQKLHLTAPTTSAASSQPISTATTRPSSSSKVASAPVMHTAARKPRRTTETNPLPPATGERDPRLVNRGRGNNQPKSMIF